MRQQSKIQVKVRGAIIGGVVPLICLPILAEKEEDLFAQARENIEMHPDLLEWRIDGYENVEDIERCLVILKELRGLAGNIPILATCRAYEEGGFRALSKERRLKLITSVAESGLADIVDIEICNGSGFVDQVKQTALKNQTKLILSYHNFSETPSEEFLVDKLVEGQEMGADITKLAVMPKDAADVLTLLSATNRARNENVQIPMVTVAMGGEGKISRVAGGLFGSDITFAVGTDSSAPGQLPIAELRQAMAALYP